MSIGGLTNPITLKEKGSFTLYTIDKNRRGLEAALEKVTVQMQTLPGFKFLNISAENKVNGGIGNIYFDIIPGLYLNNGYQFFVLLPPEIDIIGSPNCIQMFRNESNTVNCQEVMKNYVLLEISGIEV